MNVKQNFSQEIGNRTFKKSFILLLSVLFLVAPRFSFSFGEGNLIQTLLTQRQFLRWQGLIIETGDLSRLYSLKQYRPIWLNEVGQRQSNLSALRSLLLAADRHGLNPDNYWTADLEQMYNQPTERNQLSLEIVASYQYLKYAKDVSVGQIDPSQLEYDVKYQRRNFDAYSILASATEKNSDAFYADLDSLAPRNPQYFALAKVLARMNSLQQGAWEILNPNGQSLKIGSRGDLVLKLSQRLNQWGYNLQATVVFDESVQQAVFSFQKNNGLVADGSLGPNSRAWKILNRLPQEVASSVKLSMERLRWLPAQFEARYALVNIPANSFQLFESQNQVMGFRTITGRPFKRTPTMRDQIYKIELNPTWTVPFRIAVDDKLPHQQKDPEFFDKMKIRIYDSKTYRKIAPEDINWSEVNEKNFWYTLIQDPGINNSLGVIKFHLELNRDDIYMHDTNERYLFPELNRHKSSGCIRLEKPLEFADFLLNGDSKWTPEYIRSQVPQSESDDNQYSPKMEIPLNDKLPVYVTYQTAVISNASELSLFEDIYGQDRRLRTILDTRNRFAAPLAANDGQAKASSARLRVIGEAGPSQIFAKVRAVRCEKGKSLFCDQPIEFELNTWQNLSSGIYIIGFENSIYADYLELNSGDQKEIALQKMKIPNQLTGVSQVKFYRDLRSDIEKRKLIIELKTVGGLLFDQTQYDFGDFYLNSRLRPSVSYKFNYNLCQAGTDKSESEQESKEQNKDEMSIRAAKLCESWLLSQDFDWINQALVFSAPGRSDAEAEADMPVIMPFDSIGDLIPRRLPRLLVSAPSSMATGNFISVFPGKYKAYHRTKAPQGILLNPESL